MMRKIVFLFLILLGQSLYASGLKDFDGQPQVLEEYVGQGRWTVVMIWSHSCPICNEEVQAYDLFHHDHADGDIQVLGLSLDGGDEAMARDFLERHDLGFPNWIGDARTVARMVASLTGRPLMGTPTFLIFDRAGELRAQQVGKLDPQLIVNFVKQQEQGGSSQ